jgi:glycosyltransferase involved in cell wall biosynthesis
MALRILHLDSGRDWRGGQRQVLLLAQGLRERGHEPLVIGAPGSPLVHRSRAAGVATSAIRMRGDWDVAAMRRVRTIVRAWKPDVVHAHDARAHAIALGALIRRREIPLVVTRRVPFRPRGRVKYGRRVSRFIAVSRAVRAALEEGGVDPSRVDVVHSGIHFPEVERPRDWRGECRWPEGTVLCGVVGAMTAEKGIAALEGAAGRLPPDVRGIARLVLLGGTSSGACEIGGVTAYRAGFVDGIHAAVAGLDLLLHPSSAEGLGTAVIDAMALGVPPVAFAVGGLPELIEDGASGLLVPAADEVAFADAVTRLVRDAELRGRLGERGRVRAREFSAERMVLGTLATYGVVLGHDGAAAG